MNDSYSQLYVEVKNILGEVISISLFENKKQLSIELGGMPGIYFVQIQSSNGELATFKAIKK